MAGGRRPAAVVRGCPTARNSSKKRAGSRARSGSSSSCRPAPAARRAHARSARSAATPGSSLPSRNSSDAPPPVETWLDLVRQPHLLDRRRAVAAADDGRGAASRRRRDRLGHAARAVRERRLSRTRPSGRSRPPCLRRPDRVARSSARVCGPMSRRQPVGGDRRRVDTAPASAPPRARSATTTSTGSVSWSPAPSTSRLRRHVHLVVLDQRLAGLVALRAEEGVGHRAADQQRVDLAGAGCRSRRSCRRLWRRRGSATNGRLGFSSAPPRNSNSFSIRKPAAAGLPAASLGHAGRGGVRAVRGAEGVVHVNVAQLGQLPGEAPGRSSPRPAWKRMFSSSSTSPSSSAFVAASASAPTVGSHEADLAPQQLAQPRGARPQRHLRDRPSPWAARSARGARCARPRPPGGAAWARWR